MLYVMPLVGREALAASNDLWSYCVTIEKSRSSAEFLNFCSSKALASYRIGSQSQKLSNFNMKVCFSPQKKVREQESQQGSQKNPHEGNAKPWSHSGRTSICTFLWLHFSESSAPNSSHLTLVTGFGWWQYRTQQCMQKNTKFASLGHENFSAGPIKLIKYICMHLHQAKHLGRIRGSLLTTFIISFLDPFILLEPIPMCYVRPSFMRKTF